MNGHCSTCHVEPQCGYEHKPCDCRDRLKFKPKAAEQPDQPTPFDVPTMNHIARRKLGELVADGHDVCGLMIQRQNADGTVTRGAVSAGGMVIWWQPERAQIGQGEPDGWKLVPVEPTPEMLNCGPAPTNEAEKFVVDVAAGYRKNICADMLSASPAPHPAFAFRECEDSQAGIEPKNSAAQEEPVKGEWVERWYGSKTDEGWSILFNSLVPRDKVAYLGTGVSAEAVQSIVYAHNQAISAPQQKPLTDEQITAGAKALCKRSSELFGVNADDNWNLESEYFKDDARCVLEAAHGIGKKK